MSDIINVDFSARSIVDVATTHEKFCAARRAMLSAYINWINDPATKAADVKDEAEGTTTALNSIPEYLAELSKGPKNV